MDGYPTVEQLEQIIKIEGHIILIEKFPHLSKEQRQFFYSTMQNDGKYMLDLTAEDDPKKWILRRNPTYKEPTFWSKRPYFEKLSLIIIGAILGLIANLLISKSTKQSQHLLDKQQDSLIKDVTDSVKKIQKSQIH